MKQKKKILFFFNDFQIGGAHLQMTYLIQELKGSSYEPVICTHMSDRGGLREAYLSLGVPIYNLSRKHALDFSIFSRLKSILVSERIEIIVLFLPQNFVYYRLVKWLIREKIYQVGLLRAMGFWLGHKSRMYRFWENRLASWFIGTSDIVLTNSNAIKAKYDRQLQLPSGRIKVIPNASDFAFSIKSQREEMRSQLGIKPNETLVVMVARLDPWKDFDTLFKAAVQLKERTGQIKIILCGGGELEQALKEKIKAQALGSIVNLLGEKKNVAEYINAADVSVLITKGEGFSNAIMEAMALAKPVIASNVGGNSELLGTDGSCGFLLGPGEHGALAGKLLELHENKTLARETGLKARERILHLCNRKRNMNLIIEQLDALGT